MEKNRLHDIEKAVEVRAAIGQLVVGVIQNPPGGLQHAAVKHDFFVGQVRLYREKPLVCLRECVAALVPAVGRVGRAAPPHPTHQHSQGS